MRIKRKFVLFSVIFCCSEVIGVKHSGQYLTACGNHVQPEEKEILASMQKVETAIIAENIMALEDALHPVFQIGVETDRTMRLDQIKKEFKRKGMYYERLFDSIRFRKRSKNHHFISIKDELKANIQKFGKAKIDIAWIDATCSLVDVYFYWPEISTMEIYKYVFAKHNGHWYLAELIIRQDI